MGELGPVRVRWGHVAAAVSFIAIASVIGCSSERIPLPETDEFFQHFPGVELYMPARELVRIRPTAEPAPLVGYEEVMRYPVIVRFEFPRAVEDGTVHPLAPLVGMHWTRLSPDSGVALNTWRERVASYTESRGEPPRCFRLTTERVRSVYAEWGDTLRLSAAAIVEMHPDGQGHDAEVLTRFGIAGEDRAAVPPGARPMPCPLEASQESSAPGAWP